MSSAGGIRDLIQLWKSREINNNNVQRDRAATQPIRNIYNNKNNNKNENKFINSSIETINENKHTRSSSSSGRKHSISVSQLVNKFSNNNNNNNNNVKVKARGRSRTRQGRHSRRASSLGKLADFRKIVEAEKLFDDDDDNNNNNNDNETNDNNNNENISIIETNEVENVDNNKEEILTNGIEESETKIIEEPDHDVKEEETTKIITVEIDNDNVKEEEEKESVIIETEEPITEDINEEEIIQQKEEEPAVIETEEPITEITEESIPDDNKEEEPITKITEESVADDNKEEEPITNETTEEVSVQQEIKEEESSTNELVEENIINAENENLDDEKEKVEENVVDDTTQANENVNLSPGRKRPHRRRRTLADMVEEDMNSLREFQASLKSNENSSDDEEEMNDDNNLLELPESVRSRPDSIDDVGRDLKVDDERRKKAVNELFTTEETYVQGLKHLVNVYVIPLREKSSSLKINAQDMNGIFSNIEVILNLHETFLGDLQSAGTDNDDIAGVILNFVHFFKMYTQYVAQYTTCLKTMQSLGSNKKFQAFLQEQQKQTKSLDIMSYLIMPVQRIPRYEMLLREIVKHTHSSHPQFENLKTAFDRVHSVANQLNERKRHIENMSEILDFEQHVKSVNWNEIHKVVGSTENTFMIPTRHLLQKGQALVKEINNPSIRSWDPSLPPDEIIPAKSRARQTSDSQLSLPKVRAARNNKSTFTFSLGSREAKWKMRQLVLFNDLAIWMSDNKYKGCMSLSQCRTFEMGAVCDQENAFEVYSYANTKQPKLVQFAFQSTADRDKWLKSFCQGISWQTTHTSPRTTLQRFNTFAIK